ncbi:MAG: hypothetical protein OEW05_10770 [Candidatus Aminicenantes bacterium]|nr:hypothetical protein [Candidatus Aminicenantes bacterium]
MAEDKKKTEAPETPAAEGTPRRKKINELSPAEIETALAEAKEKQGGWRSRYAHQLLARKKALGIK